MQRNGLGLKFQQKQALSPQQIALMKLLQIATVNLNDRIIEELEVNPALEIGDNDEDEFDQAAYEADQPYEAATERESTGEQDSEFGNDEYADASSNDDDEYYREDGYEFDEYIDNYIEDDPTSYKEHSESYGIEEESRTIPIAFENTFHEYLEQQLGLLNLGDERLVKIAQQIIGSIDDDGYLRRDPIAIVDDIMFGQNLNCTEAEVLQLLAKIQSMDPPGTGARDLQECLVLQIAAKQKQNNLSADDKKYLKIAHDIVKLYFDEFSKKHYPKLQRQLGVSEEELKSGIDEILRLNPKPASGYVGGSRNVQYILPDFIITNNDGELELDLHNRNKPELRISNRYHDMLRAYKASRQGRGDKRQQEAAMFIRQKIEAARWFIDAIEQRYQTMYKTMLAIMQYQYEFFLTGDQKKLKPMILKDIADLTELDISTVSRVANSKFVETEFGTYRLKEFFSESLQTNEGEDVSTLEVKQILDDIIKAENKRKPLSDEKLKSLLMKKGYNIARRTVAKYREQLKIPVARLRKGL